MKLILLIFALSIFLFKSKTFDDKLKLNTPTDTFAEDEEDGALKKRQMTFQEHFRLELQKNNNGDLGREKFNYKFQKFTDMVQTIASEFGAEIIFPQQIEINQNKISKVEVSFPIDGLSGGYIENIREKFKNSKLITDAMEYQLLVKVCMPENNKPYVDMHCPKDKCEENYKIHNEKEKCDNIPVMVHDSDSDTVYKGITV